MIPARTWNTLFDSNGHRAITVERESSFSAPQKAVGGVSRSCIRVVPSSPVATAINWGPLEVAMAFALYLVAQELCGGEVQIRDPKLNEKVTTASRR